MGTHWAFVPRSYVLISFIVFSIFVGALQAQADDDAHKFGIPVSIDNLYFEPQANLAEESQGGAGPVLWSAGIRTKFANWIDARISVGAPELLYRPSWSATPTNGVNLIDGIVTLHSSFGDVYGGQFMVPWGLEGQTLEPDLWLPRTLFYQVGAFPLRDIGAGFRTEADGYYMNLAVHNGEGAELSNLDQRMFVTGQWGYKGPANSNLGLSLTTGRVSRPNLPVEDFIRGGNAFFGFNIFGLGLQLEGSLLQEFSQDVESDVLAWHGDVEHPLTEHINLVGRYEQYNPDTRNSSSDRLDRIYLGGEFHSLDNISRFFVFLIKNNESAQEVPNDEILVSWRLTPGVF